MTALAAYTQPTHVALRLLRDAHQFKWFTVFLLLVVLYVYAVEVERRRWDIVCAGLALWLADWFNELVNSAILHVSGTSALWTVTGSTSYLILIGLTIEITFMFAVFGIVFVKQLPADPRMRILGIPNRLFLALFFSLGSVGIELLLHETGTFHWHYWWWNVPFVPLIVIFGYLWFFLVAAYVYDRPTLRGRVRVLAVLGAVDVALGVGLGIAGWL